MATAWFLTTMRSSGGGVKPLGPILKDAFLTVSQAGVFVGMVTTGWAFSAYRRDAVEGNRCGK